MYEPNMLYGNDSKYAGKDVYDEEGRFNVSFYKVNNTVKSEAGEVSMYSEDYYLIPLTSGNETILEPYI